MLEADRLECLEIKQPDKQIAGRNEVLGGLFGPFKGVNREGFPLELIGN